MTGEGPSIAELRIAADQLPVAIWMGRVPSGEVVYTNAAFREVLGLDAPPAGAVRGAFVEPYGVHKPDGSVYPESEMPFERCVAARARVVVDDLVIHRRDGRRVFLRVFAKPIFDERGELTYVLEAFTDKTREVEADAARVEGERRLSHAQRLESIGQLVAGIAHDFNNLLTVTKLVVARLRGSEPDAKRAEGLLDIETVTDSAIALVRDLLGFSGRSSQVVTTLDLSEVAASIVGLAARTFDRRIVVRVDVGEGCFVAGDRSQLEQLLINLLINGRDAVGREGGEIVVGVTSRTIGQNEVARSPAGEYVVLEVADTGCGIADEIRDRVFEPYFTTKTKGPVKGTGLGLSTVHGIVRAHRGHIDLAKQVPRGTIVRVALPKSAAAPPRTMQGGNAGAAGDRSLGRDVRTTARSILVVDDERLVRAATREALEALGFDVIEADGGEEALELVTSRSSELCAVVIDLVMPGLPTTETLARLRVLRPELPVLVVTGLTVDEELRRALDASVHFLAKPFGEKELAAALATLGL